MNESIRLHDSEVRAVREESGFCVIELVNAVVYRAIGRPFLDAGECYQQDFDIIVGGSIVKSRLPEMPCELDGGEVVADSATYSELVPTGLRAQENVSLRLYVLWDDRALHVVGSSVSILPRGEKRAWKALRAEKKEPSSQSSVSQQPTRDSG